MPKITVNVVPNSSSGKAPQGQSIGGPGHPFGSLNTQTQLRIQRVARMEIAGITDRRICSNEGFDYPALKYLRTLPEYQEVKENLLQGHLTEMDKALAGKIDVLRQEVRQAVPAALRCIVDVVNQRRDLRTALSAAAEILDRDPDRQFLKSKDPSAVSFGFGNSIPDGVMDSVSKDSAEVIDDLVNDSKKRVM